MTLVTSGTLPPWQICKFGEILFYWLIPQKIIKHANQWDCKPNPLNLIIANLCPVPVACRKFSPVVNWQLLLFMCLLACTQHMLNCSSAQFFFIFFCCGFNLSFSNILWPQQLQTIFSARFTELLVMCPFNNRLWTVVLSSSTAFVWWTEEKQGSEDYGCDKKSWMRAGVIKGRPLWEGLLDPSITWAAKKIFQLLQRQLSSLLLLREDKFGLVHNLNLLVLGMSCLILAVGCCTGRHALHLCIKVLEYLHLEPWCFQGTLES